MPADIEVDEEQLQNAFVNPNFKQKRAPQSAASKNTKNSSNASNYNSKPRQQLNVKQQPKPSIKKNYDEDR